MNQEKFEQAYVESQAQIALVLAESLGLIKEQRRSLARSNKGKGQKSKDVEPPKQSKDVEPPKQSKDVEPPKPTTRTNIAPKNEEPPKPTTRTNIAPKNPWAPYKGFSIKSREPRKPRTSIRISPEKLN